MLAFTFFLPDVEECALGTGSCPLGEDCVNTAGSFRCRGRCLNGFNMTDNDTCVGKEASFFFIIFISFQRFPTWLK